MEVEMGTEDVRDMILGKKCSSTTVDLGRTNVEEDGNCQLSRYCNIEQHVKRRVTVKVKALYGCDLPL